MLEQNVSTGLPMNKSLPPDDSLRAAFGDLSHPGNNRLLMKGGHAPDIDFLYRYEGKKWWEIDPSILEYNHACLSALSDEGLLFVLPIYLRMVIDGDLAEVGEWSNSMLVVLGKGGRGNLALTGEQFDILDSTFFRMIETGVLGSPNDKTKKRLAAARRILRPR